MYVGLDCIQCCFQDAYVRMFKCCVSTLVKRYQDGNLS